MKPAIRGSRGRMAFLWPADGRNDDEFWNYLPEGVALLTARYPVRGGLTLEDLQADADPDRIRAAARLFRHLPIDAAALGDCAASAAVGPEGARAMSQAASRELRAPAVTMIEAIQEALMAFSARRVALAAPYSRVVVDRMIAYLASDGVEVLRTRMLEAESEADIGDLPPDFWAEAARKVCVEGADAVLLGGGGVRIAPAIEAVEASLGVPVVAGPAALIWSACRRMGVDTAGAGPGRLFAIP